MPGTALPIGFSGSMRVRLPVFALVAVGTVLIAVIPFPHDARREISVAGVLFFVLVAAAFLVPWERLPDWAWLIIPIGYIAVIAIIRDAQGGSDSGLVVVYLLPIVWLSLYGRRLHLLVGLFCMDLALLVPLLIVGAAQVPDARVAPGGRHGDGHHPGGLDRLHHGLAGPGVPGRPGPAVAHRPAQRPRGRLRPRPPRDPPARRHRQRHHGRRPGRAPSPSSPPAPSRCSATGRRRWSASAPSPTSSTRPRSTSGARPSTPCATALEPVDAETAAEVPWTATRKDGQQRRCVVRVRALPVPTPRHGARRGPGRRRGRRREDGETAAGDRPEPDELWPRPTAATWSSPST